VRQAALQFVVVVGRCCTAVQALMTDPRRGRSRHDDHGLTVHGLVSSQSHSASACQV
jgi:hypothetical protein